MAARGFLVLRRSVVGELRFPSEHEEFSDMPQTPGGGDALDSSGLVLGKEPRCSAGAEPGDLARHLARPQEE